MIKYLGLHLDLKLTWRQHIYKKIEQIRIKRKEMYWLTNRRSKLSIENKLLIQRIIIKPIWTYTDDAKLIANTRILCWKNNSEKTVRKSSLKQRHLKKYLIFLHTAFLFNYSSHLGRSHYTVRSPSSRSSVFTSYQYTYNTYSTHTNVGCYARRHA